MEKYPPLQAHRAVQSSVLTWENLEELFDAVIAGEPVAGVGEGVAGVHLDPLDHEAHVVWLPVHVEI